MNAPRRREPTRGGNDAPHADDQLRSGEERLTRALAIAIDTGRATPALREAIAGYVDAARAGGFSWHQTGAAVNALMRQAASGQDVTGDVDALAERILRWSEEEYGHDR